MHDHLRHHSSEEEAKEAEGEPEICPIMSVFHHLQGIAFEVDGSIEVHLVKGLHWYPAFAMVFCSILLAVKVQVMLNWSTRIPNLLVFPRRYRGGQKPEGGKDGNTGKQGEKDAGEEPSVDLARQIGWEQGEKYSEENVIEVVAACTVGRERAILDCRVLQSHCQP